MSAPADLKIVLVKRATRLDGLVARHNTIGQARFVVESQHQSFDDYQKEHDRYRAELDIAREQLARVGRVHEVDRSLLSNYVFGPEDVVVAIGQDGLVANTLKYLEGQPLLGVNPDPERWDGLLLPFRAASLETILQEYLAGRRPSRAVTMAEARLKDTQTIRAVNDLFIGQRTHCSYRYSLEHGGRREHQSSSGIVVSTGMGSTGWFRSLVTGASIIAGHFSGHRAGALEQPAFPWDAKFLHFTVREPFPSRHSLANLVFGRIIPDEPLRIYSESPENSVIFSDGIEADAIAFNSGAEAEIALAPVFGRLIV